MRRAVVVALAALAVLVVGLAAGCGSDQDPTLAGPLPSQGSSSTVPTTRETVPPPRESGCSSAEPATDDPVVSDEAAQALSLGVSHGDLRAGAAVTWNLTVTNTGETDVELVFGSGQDGDVVLSQDDTEVYRWSRETSFTQAVRCQTLAPGATASYELPQPVLDVAAGEYELRASLAATPAPFDVATTVTVEG